MKATFLLCALFLTGSFSAFGETSSAAGAINALGLDLLRDRSSAKEASNAIYSPYSIQLALAMTYAGAAGETRAQMGRVLHYGSGDTPGEFAALSRQLLSKQTGSIQLEMANRLFGQQGFEFRQEFLSLIRRKYSAPLETLDFRKNSSGATRKINGWAAAQTHDRIRDLIPPDALTPLTRLVLANAIYFKGAWQDEFNPAATESRIFHSANGGSQKAPTMVRVGRIGYAKKKGFEAIALPYEGGDLQFLVLLPVSPKALGALEAKLTPEELADCANLPPGQVQLWLPKFKLEPPSLNLKAAFLTLGMTQAFNVPPGSANFDGMADAKGPDALAISDIFHKAFVVVDEKGTEAAAATAVVMSRETGARPVKAIEVRVDRPFLFAVQHKASGVCLFLGRVTVPQ